MSKKTSYSIDGCRAFVHSYSKGFSGKKSAICRIWVSDIGRYATFHNREDAAKILQRARLLGQKIEKFD
jgi:hypothetical protein